MTELEKPWAVFVSGSRMMTWQHADLVDERLAQFSKVRGSVLIHGAGEGGTAVIPGCDHVAEDVWLYRYRHGVPARVLRFPALWNLQNKAAGPIRNRLCAEVLAAHGPAGYRLAFLAFSAGGPGTADAIRAVAAVISRDSLTVAQEKIDVEL